MLALVTLMAGGGSTVPTKIRRPVQPVNYRVVTKSVQGGRSYSKDSHKSSHSDLSLMSNGNGSVPATNASGSGSPKLLAKIPLRAAKKRDVRNLSISPTDLGPPPKTQQTSKGQSSRNKSSTTSTPTSMHKRLNGTPAIAATTTPISAAKGVVAKSATTATIKTPQQPTKLKSITNIRGPSTGVVSAESLRSGVDQTELRELNRVSPKNGCPTPPMARDSKRASIGCELLFETEAKLKKCEEQVPQPDVASITPPETSDCDPKAPEKELKSNGINSQESTSQQPSSEDAIEEVGQTISSMTMVAAPPLDITDQYPALKPYSENGKVDLCRLAKFCENNQLERREEHRQILGLAVMVQFMSQELDAFSCKETKEKCARAKGTLEDTIVLLQQTQRDCEKLREELHAKDLEWAQRQQERELLHRDELKQAEEKLFEVQMLAKRQFRELESQLLSKDEENKQVQDAYHTEVSHKISLKQEQLSSAESKVLELQSRLQKLESLDQENREKLIRNENTHAARLAESNQREQDLTDQVKALTKELNTLKTSKEHSERDLRDRLALSQDEISVLRTSSQRRSPITSLPDSSSAELIRLTSEADSLRCVLELKQAEISNLTKANADLVRVNEERIKLSNRVALLESQNEMLRSELDTKADKEKDIHQKMEELQKAYSYENFKRKRLTFDKEELQYTLKQRSEQLQAAEAKLFEISQDSSLLGSHGRCSSGRSTLAISGTETNSSPTSPIMKGMIERNDSVSWTLEIEDEASKGGASKIVRRSGSLRSNNEQPRFAPIQRRQISGSNGHSNGLASNGGNPLSQSMSATALQRGEQEGRPLSRTRSHSMCIKASGSTCDSPQRKNRSRQSEELNLADWNESRDAGQPMCSSSPKQSNAEMHPRSSTMKLMNSEVKKFQEIQESAGEAMVSGANSEDESCSASSEDMMRSSASSTASVGSLTKRPKQPPSRMSIEEALPCCTPMEVSWSEDAADAAASGLA
ncbi:uncharacterized protein toc isoform X3 [Drosophila bipectinata]|uniref:uncharacterized protein toc isoform X3 n=1 Tax=Drosophila bipectinata TaxID=42026 RepID=UPI001C8AF725|nr:microtubule-associated tumor suppressor candidate 2 homolog isoform X4 [Drosophila bipectinata]